MGNFKVGDRVSGQWDGTSYVERIVGTLKELDAFGFAHIETKVGIMVVVPKSLRLLKKKERRRVFIDEVYLPAKGDRINVYSHRAYITENEHRLIEFVEVRKKV